MLVRCDEVQGSVVCRLTGNLQHVTVGVFRDAVAQLGPKSHVIFSSRTSRS